MACTSTIPRGDEPNWPCDGTDLLIVMWVSYEGSRVPIVCPRIFLPDVMSMPSMTETYDPTQMESYTGQSGGDHMHMMIPEDATYAQRVGTYSQIVAAALKHGGAA